MKRGEVTAHLAEWYCRWIHPDRVFDFLRQVENRELQWEGAQLHQQLGQVCRSHGYDVGLLKDDEKFPTAFSYQADLKFCAILLHLADILDFDNTRTPEEVYKYLDLGKPTDKRLTDSDIEWRKHLAAFGFKFPPERDGERYALKFSASPDHLAVEYDVRKFLDVIEEEIEKCDKLLRQGSVRWRGFKLPSHIERSEIISRGYTYGEYRFTLEQRRILELLMGENLTKILTSSSASCCKTP